VVSHGRYVTFQMAEVAVPRQMFAEILSQIVQLRALPAPAGAAGRSRMRQAATAEVCVGAGKTARFSVPLPSTANFDRLLPVPGRFAVAQVGQKRDPGLEIAGNLANVDLMIDR
jgi:hypothetical protein